MILLLDVEERDVQVLLGIIDAGVRQNGIRGAQDAVAWVMRIEAAFKAAAERTIREAGNGSAQADTSLKPG